MPKIVYIDLRRGILLICAGTDDDRGLFEEAIGCLNLFDESLSETPGDPGEILRLLHECDFPATVAQTGG